MAWFWWGRATCQESLKFRLEPFTFGAQITQTDRRSFFGVRLPSRVEETTRTQYFIGLRIGQTSIWFSLKKTKSPFVYCCMLRAPFFEILGLGQHLYKTYRGRFESLIWKNHLMAEESSIHFLRIQIYLNGFGQHFHQVPERSSWVNLKTIWRHQCIWQHHHW